MGPDAWAPQAVRYVNVGKVVSGPYTVHFDLEVTARSAYVPFDASLNRLNGRFAQINLAANHQVDLRATVKRSCSVADSCNACDRLPSYGEQVHCYAAGCSCIGVTVSSMWDCEASDKAAYGRAYNTSCAWAGVTLQLPPTVRPCSARARSARHASQHASQHASPRATSRQAMVGMTVFDFDGGANGEYVEQLRVSEYAYYKTPLRPTSGNGVSRTVLVNEAAGTLLFECDPASQ